MDALSTAQRYFDAWNQHDADAIVACFAEGGTYSDPTTGDALSGPDIGANAARLWAAFPDLAFEITSEGQTADGLVCAEWMMTGTNHGSMYGLPPTGKPIVLPGADFIRVTDGGIASVTGYFDGGAIPRQLDLLVMVMPREVGPFKFGRAIHVHSGKRTKPGAFSVTHLKARSEAEQERVSEQSRQIAIDMLGMPGFISWMGLTVADDMITVTAWESTDDPGQLMREGTHKEAMKLFFGPDVASGGFTSVWQPERINPLWVRCTECDAMVNSEKQAGICTCGAPLPEPPLYF